MIRARWLDGQTLLRMAALFVAYTVTAKMGLSFDALNGVATTVWPPTGIALVALVRWGPGVWPAVTAAALVVNLQAGPSPFAAGIMAIGNTLEAVVGAGALQRLGFRADLTRLRDVLALVLAAALGSTTLSATFGSLAVWLGGSTPRGGYGEFWSVWWFGDMISDLVIAPVLLTWSADRYLSRRPRRWIEALLLGAAVLIAGSVTFGALFVGRLNEVVRGTYVMWPILIWAAVRFTARGATTALFMLSVVSIASTVLGHGPFVRGTQHESLRLLQAYLAVTATTTITLAAALAERRQAVITRDDFLSIASHELKTPLTALKLKLAAAARLLVANPSPAGGVPADDPAPRAKLQQAMAISMRQVHRLERLVDDLLDISRLRADRLSLQLEPVPIRDLARETAARLGEDLNRAGCSLEIDVPDHLEAICDRVRIEQVLTNLLVNALKYAPGRPIKISARVEHDRARISVRDRGGGIAKVEQGRIFEPYRRLASVQHVGGLGLGLHIGRQIAEAHGGALTVQSTLGSGSEFTLELPVVPGGKA